MSASSNTKELDLNGLVVENLRKYFGETRAVRRVSFSVEPREVVAILGPSGCGKSTVLHLIAGLETPDQGSVRWNEKSMTEVPPHQRNFGLMFQEYALFPHMNVAENISFGLRMKGVAKARVEARLREVLELVELPQFGTRSIDELSGGERQRIALARTLAPEPELIMLDEPLGSLDRTLKERLMLELPQILRRTNQTVLYVTHDQEEAFAVADRVVVMRQGEVVQVGSPESIYRSPNTTFVAQFLGLDNLVEAHAHRTDAGSIVNSPVGQLELPESHSGRITLLIRPEAASLQDEGGLEILGEVLEKSFRGSSQRVVLQTDTKAKLSFDFNATHHLPDIGQIISVFVPVPAGFQVLP